MLPKQRGTSETEPSLSNPLRMVVAVVVGVVAGGVVNMALVTVGPVLIPPPPGADMTSAEGLRAAMPRLEARHFVMPFLAHAVGTLVGALVGGLMAGPRRSHGAWAVGIFFLCGGIAASFMIPAPTWFMVLDLVAAYLPMAWLGLVIANRVKPQPTT